MKAEFQNPLTDINWANYAAKVRQLNEIPYYVPQKVRLDKRLLSLEEALQLQPCIFVVGPAGWENTNLRHAHINLLDEILSLIPIWVQLDLYESKMALFGLIKQELDQYELPLTQVGIIRMLKSTKVVLITDGRTEVSPDCRDHLRKEFRQMAFGIPASPIHDLRSSQ